MWQGLGSNYLTKWDIRANGNDNGDNDGDDDDDGGVVVMMMMMMLMMMMVVNIPVVMMMMISRYREASRFESELPRLRFL